jgi:hypothetical protein
MLISLVRRENIVLLSVAHDIASHAIIFLPPQVHEQHIASGEFRFLLITLGIEVALRPPRCWEGAMQAAMVATLVSSQQHVLSQRVVG